MIELAIAFLCGMSIGTGIGVAIMCMAQISARSHKRPHHWTSPQDEEEMIG